MSRRRLDAALLSAVVLAGVLTGCSLGGSSDYRMVAYFKKTVSLYGQSDVRVLGMKVGSVRMVQSQGDRVKVTFSVHEGVPLPQGVRAGLVPQSLLGARYVQLYPAWVEGQPRLDPTRADQAVIALDRTVIPAEPDEALAALKHLLDSLDPNATGRLVTNLNADLAGNGQNVNDALHSLSALSNTLADKDQQLVHLIDNLQQFTSVLDTRETQLGRVMDLFAQTTSLLAQERTTIAGLVANLSSLSTNALDLISNHAGPLQSDLGNLADLVATLDANLSGVSSLIASLPELAAGSNLDGKAGLIAAYNPTYHRIDLRDDLGASVNSLLQALGLPLCLAIPLLSVLPQCKPGTLQIPSATPAAAAPAPPPATGYPAGTAPTTKPAKGSSAKAAAANPLAPILNLLGSGGNTSPQVAGYGQTPAPPPKPSLVTQVADLSHRLLGKL